MRNLLGRLHARPPEDLARIATFWRVPLPTSDRHRQVAALYRALTDPRTVRDAWDRLDDGERALVRLLALSDDDPPTLADLAARLGQPEPDTRAVAVRLYQAGLLARERDDDPLPVGQVPRLFLPRELALLFRRVQDEIEAGDLSDTPLRTLVELLDDTEIEEAAQIWGLTVISGLRRREDLTKRLLRQVGEPRRGAEVANRRHRDAAAIWRRVRDEPEGRPVPLAEAAAAADLAGDDARASLRLRTALAELETALLVWHTYRPDGSRWLFVPAAIRSPVPVELALPPLQPVATEAIETPGWRHPHAAAWDLLTLIRALTVDDAPAWDDADDPPRPWLRRLARRLWLRDGGDRPPAGYLEVLLQFARDEALLVHADREAARYAVGGAFRRWRDRSFAAQTERIVGWWLDRTDWPEGAAFEAVEVWGADWRAARRRLLALVASPDLALAPGVWYDLDSLAARAAACDPDLLGATFTAATARESAGDDDGRAAALAEVVVVEFLTALRWFGLAEVADIPGHARAATATAAGFALARREAPPEPPAVSGPALTIDTEGEITLRDPTPLRAWSLSAFAETRTLDRAATYRITAESLARALAGGFDLTQVVTFVTRQSGEPLPPALEAQLTAWTRAYNRVRVRRAVVLTPDDPTVIPALLDLLADAGFSTRPIERTALLVELPPVIAGEDPEAVLLALLKSRGHSPLGLTAPRDPKPRA